MNEKNTVRNFSISLFAGILILILFAGFGCSNSTSSTSDDYLLERAFGRLSEAEFVSVHADVELAVPRSDTQEPGEGDSASTDRYEITTVGSFDGVAAANDELQGTVRLTLWGGLLPVTFEADVLRVNGAPYLKLTEAPAIPIFDFSDYTGYWYGGDAETFSAITTTVLAALGRDAAKLNALPSLSLERLVTIVGTGSVEKRTTEDAVIQEYHSHVRLTDESLAAIQQQLENFSADDVAVEATLTMLRTAAIETWIDIKSGFLNRIRLSTVSLVDGERMTVDMKLATISSVVITAPADARDINDLVPDQEDLETLQSLLGLSASL